MKSDKDSLSFGRYLQAIRLEKKISLEQVAEQTRIGLGNLLLVEQVSPHLGIDRPTILYDFPASQAALAQIRPGPPAVAERFELFVSGIELANGYHALFDAD